MLLAVWKPRSQVKGKILIGNVSLTEGIVIPRCQRGDGRHGVVVRGSEVS